MAKKKNLHRARKYTICSCTSSASSSFLCRLSPAEEEPFDPAPASLQKALFCLVSMEARLGGGFARIGLTYDEALRLLALAGT